MGRRAGRLPAGRNYTLPTEAQWEYACRGGTRSRFSFGDEESDLGEYVWFTKNANDAGETYAHLVGQKKPNPWGLSDMYGNVVEWCRDLYAEKMAGGTDPEGPTKSLYRVYRGGDWGAAARFFRSAFRYGPFPDDRYQFLGLRVAAVPSMLARVNGTLAKPTSAPKNTFEEPPSRPAHDPDELLPDEVLPAKNGPSANRTAEF